MMISSIQLTSRERLNKGLPKLDGKRLRKLSRLIEGYPILESRGILDKDIASLAYDSRQTGRQSLFFAIPGFRQDGSRFIADAVRRGAAAVVTETPVERLDLSGNATIVRVENCRRAMAFVSAEYFRHPSKRLDLIGITGTNGKTTVTYLLESILQALGRPVGVIGSIDYRYGGRKMPAPRTTPESLDLNRMMDEMLRNEIRHCALEVSSHALVLQRVRELEFAAAVFTGLGRDHLDFHGTMENYRLAKKSFFKEYSAARRVVNIDDPLGREIREEVPESMLTVGIRRPADIMAEDVALGNAGSRFVLKTPWGNRNVRSTLLGEHNVYNMLSAVAAILGGDISLDAVVRGLQSLDRVPGRFECVALGQDFIVAVDYAHTDDALANALRAARTIARGKVVLVFGCGGDRDRGKRKEMGREALDGSDLAVITSDNPRSEDPDRIIRDICEGIPSGAKLGEDYVVKPDRKEAIEWAVNRAQPGDMVLIAGKGHEDYQILKTQTIHFDDREVAGEALKKRLCLD